MISENGRVHGKVKVGHVIIEGTVRGSVHAYELLECRPKAHVTGEMHYDMVEMHHGAIVRGELKPLIAHREACPDTCRVE